MYLNKINKPKRMTPECCCLLCNISQWDIKYTDKSSSEVPVSHPV